MANKKKIIVLVVGLVALAAVGYGVKSWQDARATKPSIAWEALTNEKSLWRLKALGALPPL